MKFGYYTFFFWLIWLFLITIFLKIIPDGSEIIFIIIYSIAGLGLYFILPAIFSTCFCKIEESKRQSNNTTEQNKKLFLKEQYLRRKYKYIKLNNKENIINSNIDVSDKILLLEIIHGCSPEEITMLLKKIIPEQPFYKA